MEFKVGNKEYQLGALDVFQQGHITRKLFPIIAKAMTSGAIPELINAARDPSNTKIDDVFKSIEVLIPALQEMADMSDEDYDALIKRCLSPVKFRSGAGYAPIVDPRSKVLMDQELDLIEMYQIIFVVIKEKLWSFMSARLSVLIGQRQAS